MIRKIFLAVMMALIWATPATAQVDPAARGIAVAARNLAIGRAEELTTVLGDSRQDSVYNDNGVFRVFSARNQLNYVNAMLNQRLIIRETYGKSGDRTDQFFARLDPIIASRVGVLLLQGGINNIGQVSADGVFFYTHVVTGEKVTLANVAEVTARDLIQISERARLAGIKVVIENEVGGNTIVNEKVAALYELRARIANYALSTPGVYLHDAFPAVMQTGSTIAYKANYSYDGIHINSRGAYIWAKSLARIFDRIVPENSIPLVYSAAEVRTNGRRQILNNPIFATTTGGTVGTGVSGTAPSGYSATMQGNAGTMTVGTAANANGVGNYVSMDITFSGAGQIARLDQSFDPSSGAWNTALAVGETYQMVAQVEILGNPDNLSAVYGYFGANTGSGGTTMDNMSLYSIGNATNQGPNEPAVLTLATRPFTLPAAVGAGPFAVVGVRAISSASSSTPVSIRVRQMALRRLN